jgi:glycosyltransferase involved in cell wall biosynthesis
MKTAHTSNAHLSVAIILGYYNGEQYIIPQVRSILDQCHSNIALFIFDDHSVNPMQKQALNLSKDERKKVTIIRRKENLGFQLNFLQGLQEVPDHFDFYAFSDQDDIWYPDKLKRAISLLKMSNFLQPLLYCARTEVCDHTAEQSLGLSRLVTVNPTFNNALVQNLAGGNTMVMNKAAQTLIGTASYRAAPVSHDWWCYQLITGAGGRVIYDPNLCLKYRQHDSNLVGSNLGLRQQLLRAKSLMSGRYRDWNDRNIAALTENIKLLSEGNRQTLKTFQVVRAASLIIRLSAIITMKIVRQAPVDNFGLLLGVLFRRV